MKQKLLIVLVVLALSGISSHASALTLVDDGAPRGRIIVASNAARTVHYAAKELQTYVEKITGAKLPIETVLPGAEPDMEEGQSYVFVGGSPYTRKLGIRPDTMPPDGFRIVATHNCLALVGRDYNGPPMYGMRHPFGLSSTYNEELGISVYGETGTLFAVYYFLESLGVRWFMPGKLGEVIPWQDSIEVDSMDISRAPAFEYRYVYFGPLKGDAEKARWFKRAGYGAPFPVSINHSFLFFEKYRETHPEYFALIDGKRDFDRTCQGKGSLCLSEPGTVEQAVEDAREYFDAHPWARVYPVMPNDSYNRICECGRCRGKDDPSMGEEGKFSDYVWGFVNEVAKQMYESYPDKFIACAAYGAYRRPPKVVQEFSPNVMVMVAKTRRNYWSPEYEKRICDTIAEWSKRADDIYVWEYYNWNDRALKYYKFLDDWGYSLLGLPVFFPHVTQRDLQRYRHNKVKGEFIEVDRFDWPGLLHLPIYMTGKLLWDPERDVDELLDDYCEKFYGPAAQTMRVFLRRSEEIWTKPEDGAPPYFRGGAPDRVKGAAYTIKIIDELLGYLSKAQREAAGVYRERIDLLIDETSPLLKLKKTKETH